jgi:hypothetical protein
MSMISRIIPNLFNGVSQQPASLRNPSQAELVENAYPSIALGLGKRPPTEHVAQISDEVLGNAYIATLNRDTSERYSLIVTDGELQVFDLATGTAKTLNPSNSMAYLEGANPNEDIAVVTVADYSFVVNKKKTVVMTQELFGKTSDGVTMSSIVKLGNGTPDEIWWKHVAGTQGDIEFYHIGAANYAVGSRFLFTTLYTGPGESGTIPPRPELINYVFTVKSVGAIDGSGGGTIRAASPNFYSNGSQTAVLLAYGGVIQNFTARVTTSVAHGVGATAFIRVRGATPDAYNTDGRVLRVPSTTTFDYNCLSSGALASATGTFRYEVTQGFKGSKQRFTELPTSGQLDGDMWKIEGDTSQNSPRHYVMWSASEGVWIECADPTVAVAFDPSTMPHKLVREADGTFSFASISWDKRLVGDNNSIPIPSFVGRTITDVVFYRNRLGFLSDESLILSRSGNYFNFWGETATAVLDSDPIDTTAAHTKVSILNWAIGFN